MNDVATLLQIVAALAAVASPAILLALIIGGWRPLRIVDVLVAPQSLPWPKGVQEDDCPRWDVSRIERRAPGEADRDQRCGSGADATARSGTGRRAASPAS